MAIDWSKLVGLAGPVLANMAQAKTSNRAYENNTNIVTARDAEQAAIDRAKLGQTAQELELRAAADQRIAQNEAYAKSLHSAALMGAKDASFDRSGFKGPVADISFSGGLRPSMFGAAGQDAAQVVNRQAMQELMKPPTTGSTGGSSTEAVSRNSGGVPGYEAPTTEGAGFWERALGVAGLGATIAGELMKARGVGANGPAGSPQPPAAPRPGAPQPPSAPQPPGIPATSGGNLPGTLGPGGVSVGFGTPPEGGMTTSPFRPVGSGMIGSQYTVPRSPVPPGPTAPSFSAPILTAQREQFAKRMGYRSLQDLNSALSSLGPQGQELARANVVATSTNPDGLTQWMQQVETMLGRR